MPKEKTANTNLLTISLGVACGLMLTACSSNGGPRASGGSRPDFETITLVSTQHPGPHKHSVKHPVSTGERFAPTLATHNSVRAAHNLPPLTWSSNLANYAQQWANRSANVRNCGMKHRPQSGQFKQQHGENLWWASPRTWSNGLRELQPITIQRVVKDWADEKLFYNYTTNTCKAGKQCGHYTQIVWRETQEVGCAYQQCVDKSQLWVCNYSPAGNYIGERPY